MAMTTKIIDSVYNDIYTVYTHDIVFTVISQTPVLRASKTWRMYSIWLAVSIDVRFVHVYSIPSWEGPEWVTAYLGLVKIAR